MIDNYSYQSNYTDRGYTYYGNRIAPPLDIDRVRYRSTLYCLRPSTRFRF